MKYLITFWDYISTDSFGNKTKTHALVYTFLFAIGTRVALGGMTLPKIGLVPELGHWTVLAFCFPLAIMWCFREWLVRVDRSLPSQNKHLKR